MTSLKHLSLWVLAGALFWTSTIESPADSKRPFTPRIERLDPELDQLIAVSAVVEKLAVGFNWSEGPVWKDGALLFSDVPENVMYRWKEGMEAAEVFMRPSGTLAGEESEGAPRLEWTWDRLVGPSSDLPARGEAIGACGVRWEADGTCNALRGEAV